MIPIDIIFDDIRSLTSLNLCLPRKRHRRSEPIKEDKVVMNEGHSSGVWDLLTIAKSLRLRRKQRRNANVQTVMLFLDRCISSTRIANL